MKINVYTCDVCRKMISTRDVDDGVTPFALRCLATPECPGTSYSSFYRPPSDAPEPGFEFFMPARETWPNYSEGMQEHFEHGGLDLRPIGGASLFTRRAES